MTGFVSVLMPVRNEGSFIARSVGSVLAQDYPPDRMEVLIADGMSTDGTRAIVAQLAAGDSRVRLVDKPEGIVATGLNRAMRIARGDLIVRVDGHCEIARDYVSRCVAHLEDGSVQGVGGPLETIGQTPLAAAIAAAMSSRFGVGGSAFRTVRDRSMLTDTVAFPGYTRAVMTSAGPFDEELSAIRTTNTIRLRKMGARILLAHDVHAAITAELVRLAVANTCSTGTGGGVLQKHPRQMQPRQFVRHCLSRHSPRRRGAAIWPPACRLRRVLAVRSRERSGRDCGPPRPASRCLVAAADRICNPARVVWHRHADRAGEIRAAVVAAAGRHGVRLRGEPQSRRRTDVRVTYYGQACTLIEAAGRKILTDPWLTEGAYLGTWFHTHVLADAGVTPATIATDVDYIFISHEHEDHLDPETLRHFSPDIRC